MLDMASNQYQHSNHGANNQESNAAWNPLIQNIYPHILQPQNGQGHHMHSDPSIRMLECGTWAGPGSAVNEYSSACPEPARFDDIRSDTTGYGSQILVSGPANVGNTDSSMPVLPDQFEEYLNSLIVAGPPGLISIPMSRADVWTTEQENLLLALKRQRRTFPEIRVALQRAFQVDRNVNVLSKKYRGLLARNAKENVIAQSLNGALPGILQCFDDELSKLAPEHADERLLRAVREQLRSKLPNLIRNLDLETRGSPTMEGNI